MEESLPNMVDDRAKEHTKRQVPIYVTEGLIMERKQTQANVANMITGAIQQERKNVQAEITSQINNAITNHIPSHVDSSVRNYMSDNSQLQHDDLPIWLALKIKFEGLHASNTPYRAFDIPLRDQDDPHDDAHPEGENNAKRQKTFEHGTYVFRESSSGQANESKPGSSTLGNQEQLDDFDFWTNTYATDDDELPVEKVLQELMEEMSKTVDEAKLFKVVNEMLRQRCNLGDEDQYHIDQMQNFLKNEILWESRKEILVSPFPQKPTPVIQSCQRDPKALALSLVNQDLLYLKKGNSGPEKIVLSLHKFPAVIFPDDDIEERTSRWVDKCVKKFNPYARYSVEHWKNPHAKIFYIKRQKEPRKPIKEVYSNSKIVQVIKTYGELGHTHKFLTEIIVEDYAETGLLWSLLVFIRSTVIWKRVHDFHLGVESYQQKVNLTTPTITFPGIEKHKIVLEGLKSYNNDVKNGYVTPSLNKEDTEYLQLFEEEIKERLKHRDQMRRWEMYLNGRPLASRRKCPE
ncbi:hypothetical protein Tco_0538415 [Tanacetum coccineum]